MGGVFWGGQPARPRTLDRVARDAFEGYDEPINSDMDPDDALRLVMDPAPVEDEIEPVLDE